MPVLLSPSMPLPISLASMAYGYRKSEALRSSQMWTISRSLKTRHSPRVLRLTGQRCSWCKRRPRCSYKAICPYWHRLRSHSPIQAQLLSKVSCHIYHLENFGVLSIWIGDLVLANSSILLTPSSSGSSQIVVSGCVNLTGSNLSVSVNATTLQASIPTNGSTSTQDISLDLIQYASKCRNGQFANVKVVNAGNNSGCITIGESNLDYSKQSSIALALKITNGCLCVDCTTPATAELLHPSFLFLLLVILSMLLAAHLSAREWVPFCIVFRKLSYPGLDWKMVIRDWTLIFICISHSFCELV